MKQKLNLKDKIKITFKILPNNRYEFCSLSALEVQAENSPRYVFWSLAVDSISNQMPFLKISFDYKKQPLRKKMFHPFLLLLLLLLLLLFSNNSLFHIYIQRKNYKKMYKTRKKEAKLQFQKVIKNYSLNHLYAYT